MLDIYKTTVTLKPVLESLKVIEAYRSATYDFLFTFRLAVSMAYFVPFLR